MFYNKSLSKLHDLYLPKVDINNTHVYAQYTIKINEEKRDDIIKKLKDNNIFVSIFYPKCIHLQPIYKKYGYKKGDFPIAERISNSVFSLPCYPELSKEKIQKISSVIQLIST